MYQLYLEKLKEVTRGETSGQVIGLYGRRGNIQETERKPVWNLGQNEVGVGGRARIGRALYTMLMILIAVLGTTGSQ